MRNSESRFSSAEEQADISQLIQQVLFKLHPDIEQSNVNVETDVSELVAPVHPEMIAAAIQNLVKHAIHTMPDGGEISVTLIDGNYQWELEIADSSSDGSSPNRRFEGHDSGFPIAIPHIIDQYLVDAHRLAMRHGGQIQTWDCPQGGIANVLVIPKRPDRQQQAMTRAA